MVHGSVQEPTRIEAHRRRGNRLAQEDRLRFRARDSEDQPFTELAPDEKLFKPERLGNKFERLLVNLGMVITGHREGGFFIIIARRPLEQGVMS